LKEKEEFNFKKMMDFKGNFDSKIKIDYQENLGFSEHFKEVIQNCQRVYEENKEEKKAFSITKQMFSNT